MQTNCRLQFAGKVTLEKFVKGKAFSTFCRFHGFNKLGDPFNVIRMDDEMQWNKSGVSKGLSRVCLHR